MSRKNKCFFRSIAAAALVTAFACTASAAGFAKTNAYTEGMFTDVSSAEWYADSVASSYELGFMRGTGEGVFSPEGAMTVAEAVTIAARVHDAYNEKGTTFGAGNANWYDDYVSYAIANGIIADGQFDDYDRPAKRHEMASIFASAVPADFLEAKNNVTEIPDVPATNKYFEKLQLLYNAGVIMGNDEFGTFKPNNNVTRAEAAAIINRVALPESRLQKQLVDANYGDGYYLIEDANDRIQNQVLDLATVSAWNIDSRTNHGEMYGRLFDLHPEMPVEAWRDIDDVSEGILGLDCIVNWQMGENGAYVAVTDDDKKPVFSLNSRDGKFYFNDTDTGIKVEDARYYIKLRADLDAKTAELYINGKKIAAPLTVNDGVASRVAIGSDKAGIFAVSVARLDVYKDYLVKETFLDPAGSTLCAWDVTGSAEVVRTGGQGYNDVNSAKLESGAIAKKSFNKISGKVIFESYMLFPKAEDTGYVSLNSGDTSVAKFVINADGVFKADGTKLRFHNNNIWQTLRMEVDTTEGTVTYKINGKNVGTFPMDAAASTVDNVTFGATGGTVYFDDVHVSLTHEYDDYCPTPVPVTDDGYDVILNECSLWHENGSWGSISAFPDIEPALGYYDEGIAETADWEIKFMVENGIDVQHYCWFAPSGDVKEPMKQPPNNWALHDGFFNAKYSDMMKFTFMWENTAVNVYSWEQFKEYIWDYWMDYYFTDERFYTVDNKLVFTVWSDVNFKKAFGDDAACRDAVAKMNEDAKAHGFDGVMIFFADGHHQDAASFEQMAALGADASYAYHWQQDGNSADKTIARLQRNQDYGKLHVIPTVSVGFNNVGWSGERKPLISLDDHKKVASYIKDTYLPKLDGWKAKTVVVSTWNEYGEGTYVMPCKGLHGFGYLENIAEVFSGVTDHSNNIYPTEGQKARLGHLYPKSKTSLEHLDTVKPEPKAPDKVLYTAKGSDMMGLFGVAEKTVEGNKVIIKQTENDGGLVISEASLFEPMDMAGIIAVRLTVKADTASLCEMFFTTEAEKGYSQAKSLNFRITPMDDFWTYTVNTSDCVKWDGTLTGFRIDVLDKPGTYEIMSLELLGYSDELLPMTVAVGDEKYVPLFRPEERNGELYITAVPDRGFFKLHNFYYEWSRFTGKLRIVSSDDKEVVFTVGSDKALVNGAEKPLKEPVTLIDGIPVVPLYFLYDSLGISYTVENKTVKPTLNLTDFDAKKAEIANTRVPYQYEFNVDYDFERFLASNTTLNVLDGALRGTAQAKGDGSYDPIISVGDGNLDLDASKYNKLAIAIRYNSEKADGEHLHVYFTTKTDGGASESKSYGVNMKPSSADGSYAVYEFDLTQNDLWRGTIASLRVDPIEGAGSFDIDYIRVTFDDAILKKQEEAWAKLVAKGFEIINGDAEDTENVAFYRIKPNDKEVSIIFDEEKKSNVYSVACSGYTYIRQNVIWEPGKTYHVKVDVKFVQTVDGSKDFQTDFLCNIRYHGSDGAYDHIVFGKKFGPADGWQTLEFTFTLPKDFDPEKNDEFTFFSNPIGNTGAQYYIDNLTVDCK